MNKKMIALTVLALFAFGVAVAYAGTAATPAPAPKIGDTVKDAVDGHDVVITATTPKSEYKGKTYYFCSAACKTAFDATPAKFVK